MSGNYFIHCSGMCHLCVYVTHSLLCRPTALYRYNPQHTPRYDAQTPNKNVRGCCGETRSLRSKKGNSKPPSRPRAHPARLAAPGACNPTPQVVPTAGVIDTHR